ncbi:MAG: SRPBCC domain-containing protein [Planctomycetota bacterium]
MPFAKALVILVAFLVPPTLKAQEKEKSVQSEVTTAENGDIFMTQEVVIDAPIKKVWAAYTTSEGWQGWVAPVAKVDLKIGGLIKTNYRKDGKLTDDDAITLHVINYVPERMLTLQAELADNFPKILKAREKQMYNVITFGSLKDDKKTKLVSYGIGYKDSPELQSMMKFFIQANEQSYLKLKEYVEKNK